MLRFLDRLFPPVYTINFYVRQWQPWFAAKRKLVQFLRDHDPNAEVWMTTATVVTEQSTGRRVKRLTAYIKER